MILPLQFEVMKSENASLHVQLENLSTQLSALRQMATENEEAGGGGNTSKLDSSLLSKSFHEDDAKSTDQLMEIVKYLRKEKALSEQKVEVVQVRNQQRLKLQHCWHLATLYSAATSEDLAISLFRISLRVVF